MRILFLFMLWCNAMAYGQQRSLTLVNDYCPGACYSSPFFIGTLNNKMIVFAWDGSNQHFLSYTSKGLYQAKTFPDLLIPWNSLITIVDNHIYYCNYKPLSTTTGPYQYRIQLYKWDGNNDAVYIRDIDTAETTAPLSSTTMWSWGVGYDTWLVPAYGDLVIKSKKHNYLYHPATNEFEEIPSSQNIALRYKNKMYWTLKEKDVGMELFAKDMTAGQLKLVENISDWGDSDPSSFIEYEGYMYFIATSSKPGRLYNLYQYDGINAPVPVVTLKDSSPFPYLYSEGYVCYLVGYNNKIYYIEGDDAGYPALYAYDLQTNEIKLTLSMQDNKLSLFTSLVRYKNMFTFSSNDSTGGLVFYNIDSNKLERVALPDASTAFRIYNTYEYDNALYLRAQGDAGVELYKYADVLPIIPGVTLYPNPTSGNAYLETRLDTTNVLTLIVQNTLGQQLYLQRLGIYPKGEHTIDIPLQHLANGVYICTLRGSKNILYKGKVVKL